MTIDSSRVYVSNHDKFRYKPVMRLTDKFLFLSGVYDIGGIIFEVDVKKGGGEVLPEHILDLNYSLK